MSGSIPARAGEPLAISYVENIHLSKNGGANYCCCNSRLTRKSPATSASFRGGRLSTRIPTLPVSDGSLQASTIEPRPSVAYQSERTDQMQFLNSGGEPRVDIDSRSNFEHGRREKATVPRLHVPSHDHREAHFGSQRMCRSARYPSSNSSLTRSIIVGDVVSSSPKSSRQFRAEPTAQAADQDARDAPSLRRNATGSVASTRNRCHRCPTRSIDPNLHV